jgi:hypothetical protein
MPAESVSGQTRRALLPSRRENPSGDTAWARCGVRSFALGQRPTGRRKPTTRVEFSLTLELPSFGNGIANVYELWF